MMFAFSVRATLLVGVVTLGAGGTAVAASGSLPVVDPAAAAAIQAQSPDQQQAAIKGMVESLQAKLDKNPNNLNGWHLLERSYRVMGDTQKADAVAVKVKTLQAQGVITADADATATVPPVATTPLPVLPPPVSTLPAPTGTTGKSSFIRLPPPQAMTTEQGAGKSPAGHDDGSMDAMVEGLRQKLEKNPNNLPGWILLANSYRTLGKIKEADAVLAKVKSLQAKGVIKDTPPPAADKDAAQVIMQAPADQQKIMIRGMVDGLAARLKQNPDDVEGWQRLARSYRVLGETEKADAADAKVKALQAKAGN